jgi:hypothetical protein
VEFKAARLKLEVQPVDSLDLPELAPYRTMKWQYEHRQEGIFVAEGEKVVRRLLESDMEIISLLLPPKWLEDYADLLARRPEQVIRAFTCSATDDPGQNNRGGPATRFARRG